MIFWYNERSGSIFQFLIFTAVVKKKVFLDADNIPRVSNDTREREDHRQPSLTRLTKVWRGRGERERGDVRLRGLTSDNERSQPAGTGRVLGHSFTLDWWPGPELGMGRCHWAAGGDSHQSLLLLLCIYMFIYLSIHNCSTFSQQVKNKGKSLREEKD